MGSKDLRALADHPELPLARRVERFEVPMDLVIKLASFSAAISLCVQLSGLEDKEVYIPLGIDSGHWTRIKQGKANFPENKLRELMDLCGNEVPLIWLAYIRGYGLVLLKSEAERRAEAAELRAQEAEKKLAWAMEFMREGGK